MATHISTHFVTAYKKRKKKKKTITLCLVMGPCFSSLQNLLGTDTECVLLRSTYRVQVRVWLHNHIHSQQGIRVG